MRIHDNEDIGIDPGPSRDDMDGCDADACADCGFLFDTEEGSAEVLLFAGESLCEGCMDEREDARRSDEADTREEGYLIDGVGFADPGGNSALRAATESNPRNLPCPSCGAPDALTPADRARGYQCDGCALRAEGGGY